MDPSKTWDEIKDGPYEWKNGRLTFQEPVSTLLEISSFRAALEIWNGCISRAGPRNKMKDIYDCNNYYGTTCDYLDESKELVANLNLPPSIENSITNNLCRIFIHIDRWVYFLSFDIFSLNRGEYCISRMNPEWLSWCPNGEIDYERTVSNMLSSAELSKLEKFIVMCKFCRKDELMTISLDSLPSYFIERITFVENPVVFYWICYLRNELDKIPMSHPSADVRMARLYRSTVFEFQYFWDRLNSYEQIMQTIYKLKTKPQFGYILLKKFLPKMTQCQQYQVFCNEPAVVVKIFWTVLYAPKMAISIWLRVKDQCTDVQFKDLVLYLLHTDIITSEEDMKLFVDLWKATPVHLKQPVTQIYECVSDVMEVFCRQQNHPPSCFTFLYEYLSLCNDLSRKRAMQEISNKLSTRFAHSLIMIDVIKLCYPIDEERAAFLQSILDSKITRKHGLGLMNDGKFASLFLMLKIVSPNATATREFVRGLLEFAEKCINIKIFNSKERHAPKIKFEKWKFVVNHDKWRELSRFIDETCASDDDRFWVADLKKQFVLSFASADGFFWHINDLNKLSKVVEEVFTSEEAQVFKNTLLDIFKREIITQFGYWKNYDERNFVEFVSWCLGDSRKIEEFKLSVPRDDISESIFRSTLHALPESNLSEYFEILNKCMRSFWSIDEAKKYKIRKIYEFNDKIVLGIIFRRNTVKNLKPVLQHVFDNDVGEMEKWRLKKQNLVNRRKYPGDRYEPICYNYYPKFHCYDFAVDEYEEDDDHFEAEYHLRDRKFDNEKDLPFLKFY